MVCTEVKPPMGCVIQLPDERLSVGATSLRRFGKASVLGDLGLRANDGAELVEATGGSSLAGDASGQSSPAAAERGPKFDVLKFVIFSIISSNFSLSSFISTLRSSFSCLIVPSSFLSWPMISSRSAISCSRCDNCSAAKVSQRRGDGGSKKRRQNPSCGVGSCAR